MNNWWAREMLEVTEEDALIRDVLESWGEPVMVSNVQKWAVGDIVCFSHRAFPMLITKIDYNENQIWLEESSTCTPAIHMV